jgi:hypothetical protein
MDRKPSYLRSEQGRSERWLISYADVLTVLLILFVAMAAESPGNKQPGCPIPCLARQRRHLRRPRSLNRLQPRHPRRENN